MSSSVQSWSDVVSSEAFDAKTLSDLVRSVPLSSGDRSTAWRWLISDRVKEDKSLQKYDDILQKKAPSKEILKEIVTDVSFVDESRRDSVTKVLSAYSSRHGGDYYFSGLHFLVEVLQSVLGSDSEEASYQVLVVLLDIVLPRHYTFDIYGGNVSKLHALTYLIHHDSELRNHLEDLGGRGTFFLDSWFMRFCTSPLPREVYLVFIDLLLCVMKLRNATDVQGEMVVISFVAAILARLKTSLLACSTGPDLEKCFNRELQRISVSDIFEKTTNTAFSMEKEFFLNIDSKIQTILDNENQSLDRSLWSETTINFGDASLGASLKKYDSFIVVKRFKRFNGGGPGAAESSGKIVVDTAITKINGKRIKSKYDVKEVVKRIKDAEKPLIVNS